MKQVSVMTKTILTMQIAFAVFVMVACEGNYKVQVALPVL